ncbi:MAG: hypothetical protein HC840_00060 [Leptolyngbyaceae cyanobacterium RM2_2_4]|nr:hypothetical protein [Leptolyngbyaceae cyanobacterium RM2_2_4]
MIGISSSSKEQIAAVVEDMFDTIALQFIGDIPKLKNKKTLTISSKRNFGLGHLFVQAMQNKTPNPVESDVLKSLLESAYGYIESLKNRTKSNVTERIDGIMREAKLQNRTASQQEIRDILQEELSKARSHMKAIAESEATKLRNLGTMMDISRVAANLGDDDPTVFFVVVKDGSTCKECIKLHLMPDQITPRLWKFSELKQGYHKRGESYPSAFGLHPHCRCTLTYLSSGFGFNKQGLVSYQNEDYDAYSRQRKK